MDKLYVIVRRDMDPGYMVAQSCHAIAAFGEEHSEINREWMRTSNYIAVLECENENALLNLINKADKFGVKFSMFLEPDLNNELTAVALEPCQASKKLCSSFRLALRKK
jgi:peptidyl-tRNA hydrolase